MDARRTTFEAIAPKVRQLIAESLSRPIEDVALDVRLDSPELALDSLAFIKLNVILEETFDVTMPDFMPEQAPLLSVRDVVAAIAAQVDTKRAEGGAR
jgi:acyl carrier protein